MTLALVVGFATSLGLIVAIGAQNAFVLRQGLRREHLAAVIAVCISADVLLIGTGVAGLGEPLRAHESVLDIVRYAGSAFLFAYGLLALRRMLRPGRLLATETDGGSLRAVIASCLGITFLNPHVYLDTVLLLGSIANQYDTYRWWFGAGAIAGSITWFLALGCAARLLAPLFARPGAWRVLDGGVAAVMFAIAGWLAIGGPAT